jgi:3-isopropylmalate/(R)-2-methylmalate dehydratase large subunit
MLQTAVEKIISRHAGATVSAGDLVRASVDRVMATDGNAPLAIRLLREELGADERFDASHVILVIDHCAPAPDEGSANLQAVMRDFARESGARLYDAGAGISHVVLPEQGDVGPGMLVVGSDSHTVTYGAVNCMGTGMGSTDTAVAMYTGRTWLRVPQTMRVELHGELPAAATAKDLALAMVDAIGVDGATYKCLEVDGPALASLSMEQRFTIANMSVEMGAKCCLMPVDDVCRAYVERRRGQPIDGVSSDPGCTFADTVELDLAAVRPLASRPHDLTEMALVEDLEQPIDLAFIGTCTNGRLSDLRQAADVLRGRRVHPGVRLVITPGSRDVLMGALRDGLVEIFVEAGAIMTPPGCGPCVGAHQGIPADGEVVVTSANRNFQGRMGNRKASIFVASPETVAASAVAGRLVTPSALE